MIGDTLNVLHHRDWILEDRRVDALQNDPVFPIAVIKRHAIRIVNVPAAVRLRASKSLLDFEHARDRDKAEQVDHRHSLCG